MWPQYDAHVTEPGGTNTGDARRLRARQTESESALWEALRDRRLDGYKFRRQHPIRNFVVDFYCAQPRLIVEVDGGLHRNAESRDRDLSRQETIEKLGYRFLRIPAILVTSDIETALDLIRAELATGD